MTSHVANVPVANLHAPEELLEGAEALFASSNDKMMRAAVLEAITALEAFVEKVVFSALRNRIDPLLVTWLEKRTNTDFDSRLSKFVPVALARPVDEQSTLWKDYKKARSIRNRVTHSGLRVSPKDARFVIDTVYQWLAYLGSTIEFEVALMGLKRYVETNWISIQSEKDVYTLVNQYFKRMKTATASIETRVEVDKIARKADVLLRFGPYSIVVETKLWRSQATVRKLKQAIQQTQAFISATGIELGAVIVFQTGEVPPSLESILKSDDGKTLAIVIKSP